MSKLLVLLGFMGGVSVFVAGPAAAQSTTSRTAATSRPAASVTLDEKKAWFRDAIDDVLTGSGAPTAVGRSEAQGTHRP